MSRRIAHWSYLAVLFLLTLVSCKSQHGVEKAVDIENTYWRLIEVEGLEVTTPANGREVHMILSADGSARVLKGYAGCNGLGGDYTLDDNAIRFQPITTKMFCESQMDVENRFTRILASADNFRLEGKTLQLYSADRLLGRFEAIDQ